LSQRGSLVALFTADVVSALGSRVSLVAIPWLVLVTTGSAVKMGLAAAASTIPNVLASVFGPPLADRLGLRRTMLLSDAGCALTTAAIAMIPNIGFGAIVVLVAASGALRGVGARAKHVLLRPIAEAAGARMIRVTAAYDGLQNGATLVGAPLGGLLIYWLGAQGAIWVDAVSYAASLALVAALVRPRPELLPVHTTREPYLVAIRAGARYLKGDRVLFGMLLMVFVINIFTTANASVFVPLWVADVFDAAPALGLVLGAFAAGAVLGNIVYTALAPKLPRYMTFTVGLALCCAPRMLAIGLSDGLALVVIVTFLSGLALAPVNPILGATLYERIPAELQTRVFGLVAAISFAGFPIGGLAGGWAVASLGLDTALLVAAGICIALTVVVPLSRYRRNSEHVQVT
jgi:MFS family permease